MLSFLNIFFFIFHSAITLFNVFGWIPPKTRRLNLVTLLLTAGSWFILGIWYGWGYCLCTDWHWDVREKMGISDKSDSYIHFLLLKLTGVDFNKTLVDTVTVIVFFAALITSCWLNVRDFNKRRSGKLVKN